jgi:cation-transporting ATPase E
VSSLREKIKRNTEPTESGAKPEPEVIYSAPEQGLTAAQVEQLRTAGKVNRTEDPNVKTTGEIIKSNTLTFFNLVFVVLAALLALAGRFTDMAFLGIAAINSVIGIVQQLRSRNTLAKLELLAESKVKVIRDGKAQSIPSRELVLYDVAELGAGDQIPADCVVLEGQVQVNESLLTGEADSIIKNPGDELLSGSFVVTGRCRARMEKVGADSYAARLANEARGERSTGASEMVRSLDKLIRVIGFAIIPIGLLLFYNDYHVQGNAFNVAIPSVVAALIGMIPEGLYLLTTMALAVSVMRLAKRKTLVHEMSSIEILARVDVLCVDKTGTITSPQMQVQDVVYLNPEQFAADQVDEAIGSCYAALGADNETAKAMAERFKGNKHWKAESTVPFDSANKWSAVSFAKQGSYVIGAPEIILGDDYKAFEEQVADYSSQGIRVLLAAKCDSVSRESGIVGAVQPMALVLVANPIRPEAEETFKYFARQGVAVKVISGDNPATVSAVAVKAGIHGAENYIDARELKEPEDYANAVANYTVFGRVTPEQKRKLVKALQAAGHKVAMTGDGVNDVLALKDADCGIAMASGAEAACHVAQLVLLSSDFSAMPHIVDEGRRVINNIQRSAALYLVKNIMSFFLALITLFAGLPYPFVPIQLTLISSLTIGIPSFILALEPNHELVRGKFMRNVLRMALPGGLSNIVLIMGVELFTLAFGFERATLGTMSTVLMGVMGLLVLYYISRPMDWKRWALLGTMAVSFLVAVTQLGGIFQLSALNFQSALVITVFLMLAPSVIWFFQKSFDWGGKVYEKFRVKAKTIFSRKKTGEKI